MVVIANCMCHCGGVVQQKHTHCMGPVILWCCDLLQPDYRNRIQVNSVPRQHASTRVCTCQQMSTSVIGGQRQRKLRLYWCVYIHIFCWQVVAPSSYKKCHLALYLSRDCVFAPTVIPSLWCPPPALLQCSLCGCMMLHLLPCTLDCLRFLQRLVSEAAACLQSTVFPSSSACPNGSRCCLDRLPKVLFRILRMFARLGVGGRPGTEGHPFWQ